MASSIGTRTFGSGRLLLRMRLAGSGRKAARVAAVALVALTREEGRSLGVQLLEDIRTVFGDNPVMSTKRLLEGLCNLDE